MSKRSVITLGVLGGILLALTTMSASGAYHTRQYYGHYRYYKPANYYYRPYYYKPTPSYAGYRHHYVTYYPSRPKYQYYYNTYQKRYWGRCPSKNYGKPQYSLLAQADRKPTIDEIPEKSFPPFGEMPSIPESEDNEKMDLPPDDLPGTGGLPK